MSLALYTLNMVKSRLECTVVRRSRKRTPYSYICTVPGMVIAYRFTVALYVVAELAREGVVAILG